MLSQTYIVGSEDSQKLHENLDIKFILKHISLQQQHQRCFFLPSICFLLFFQVNLIESPRSVTRTAQAGIGAFPLATLSRRTGLKISSYTLAQHESAEMKISIFFINIFSENIQEKTLLCTGYYLTLQGHFRAKDPTTETHLFIFKYMFKIRLLKMGV